MSKNKPSQIVLTLAQSQRFLRLTTPPPLKATQRGSVERYVVVSQVDIAGLGKGDIEVMGSRRRMVDGKALPREKQLDLRIHLPSDVWLRLTPEPVDKEEGSQSYLVEDASGPKGRGLFNIDKLPKVIAVILDEDRQVDKNGNKTGKIKSSNKLPQALNTKAPKSINAPAIPDDWDFPDSSIE